MSKFYIQDSTIGKYVTFDSVPDVVRYFDQMIPRAHKMTRKQFMQNLIDLGHGYDDAEGVTITRAMSEQFNIGVVRNNSYVKTDIHTATRFVKEGYGD